MKKLLRSAPFIFMLLLLCCYTISNAQDSTKAKIIKPAAKPVPTQAGAVKYPAKPNTAHTYPTNTAAAPAQGPATPATAYTTTPVSTDKSLAGQYQYVLSKTYHYQQPMIAALWQNVNDTLKLTRQKLKDANTKLTAQSQALISLQNDIKAKQQTLDDATNSRDEISLLGLIPLSKTLYNLVMWGLVIGLGLVLVIVILKTTGNSREAKYRTKLYEELSEEFQAYKVKANEKEKKLARELQTERNKVDELMGRG